MNLFNSSWSPKELDVQGYILSACSDEHTLPEEIFGEDLLVINKEVRTNERKRADILAVDRMGSGVIIELKCDLGRLGVETQALQYLAGFSSYKGAQFINQFAKSKETTKEKEVLGFVGGNARLEDINRHSRIMLVARSFDPSLYSMGEWLSNSGVACRCIEFTPLQIGNEQFISFSVKFDRTPISLYPLLFANQMRAPGFFWHNIGHPTDEWWQFLVRNGEISTGFENQPGDHGERILQSYIPGDTIVAYANKYGAVGWGKIDGSKPYRLVERNGSDDQLHGHHLHRRGIIWHAAAAKLESGIRPNVVLDRFGIYHPVATWASIPNEKAKSLIDALTEKCGRMERAGYKLS